MIRQSEGFVPFWLVHKGDPAKGSQLLRARRRGDQLVACREGSNSREGHYLVLAWFNLSEEISTSVHMRDSLAAKHL